MRTIHTLPGSIGFSEGSDRSGHQHAGFRKTVRRTVANWLVSILNNMADAQRRRDDVRALREMDDRTLKDMGITRERAMAEADRLSRL